MRDLKNLKEKIEAVLEEWPRTRDSDAYLTLKIWLKYYPQRIDLTDPKNPKIAFKDILELPREDHVKRIRAKIQNEEKKWLPTTWEVAKQRKILEADWRAWSIEQKVKDEYDPLKGRIL